jgi:hypothetical protein
LQGALIELNSRKGIKSYQLPAGYGRQTQPAGCLGPLALVSTRGWIGIRGINPGGDASRPDAHNLETIDRAHSGGDQLSTVGTWH